VPRIEWLVQRLQEAVENAPEFRDSIQKETCILRAQVTEIFRDQDLTFEFKGVWSKGRIPVCDPCHSLKLLAGCERGYRQTQL
jgi:hypothetical protein